MSTGVSRRSNAIVILTVSVLLFVFGIISSLRERKNLTRQLEQTVAVLQTQLSVSLPAPIWNVDSKRIEDVLRAGMTAEEVVALVVTGPKGTIAVMERDPGGKSVRKDEPSALADTRTVEVPIVYDDNGTQKALGTVRLHTSMRHLDAVFRTSLILLAGQILILDLVLILVLSLLAKRMGK